MKNEIYEEAMKLAKQIQSENAQLKKAVEEARDEINQRLLNEDKGDLIKAHNLLGRALSRHSAQMAAQALPTLLAAIKIMKEALEFCSGRPVAHCNPDLVVEKARAALSKAEYFID